LKRQQLRADGPSGAVDDFLGSGIHPLHQILHLVAGRRLDRKLQAFGVEDDEAAPAPAYAPPGYQRPGTQPGYPAPGYDARPDYAPQPYSPQPYATPRYY
jgi:hypothetical protein